MQVANVMKRLLSPNQLLILRVLYTNPTRSFYMHELGEILGKKPGVFQRTLNGLAEEGFVYSVFRANARFFKANTDHPLYPELKKIVAKTSGAEGMLRHLMEKLRDVKMALMYGSFAKGTQQAASDIDILIVGKPTVENKFLKEIPRLEKSLQREVNYKLYSKEEFRKRKKSGDEFLEEVLGDKYTVLKGNPDAL